jgi:hypothetical protein
MRNRCGDPSQFVRLADFVQVKWSAESHEDRSMDENLFVKVKTPLGNATGRPARHSGREVRGRPFIFKLEPASED